ncbi:P-loop containing nucleoside triphosphate hydrolase protein [Dioszegia hungarica]|uniref:ATP-dependent RNA helicase n=1 Tax=Dioszegia hungarica TaxID=4972 RepID=A0AA38LQI2_9TREE|nr:P-loop containing nucleoside triphosphate hydrolase protein [Dioszegia hungarica]KAI9631920.1 P-loop containing nucleoside triphosphate hydrolase protein [Dioszegia hungarica]
MSAPPARGGSRGGFRGRGGPRKPQQPRAAGSAIPQQFSGVASTTDSTPAPSGTVTPAVEGGSGVRFRDFEGLSEQVLKGIPFECTDYQVQAATLPAVLAGRDLLAQAKTGTGKTLAFLVPTIQRLITAPAPPASSTSVLILSPTRELAMQISVAAEGLLRNHQDTLGVRCVVGGTNMQKDIRDLKSRRADILIATPGRLLDLIENAGIAQRFAGIRSLILDEADRLLDQGFRRELVKIIESLPQKSAQPRQTLLFSATIPAEVHNIASLALDKNHEFISTLTEEDVNVHEHVIQESLVVPDTEVLVAGAEVIFREQSLSAERGGFKVMVFLPTARSAAIMADIFNGLDASIAVPVWEIHSRMSQPARIKAIEHFRAAPTGVLFSSDVMARGIDVKGVTGVVQIGLPANPEQYVHRLGRTARAGSKGHGVVVLGAFESSFLRNKILQTFNILPYSGSTPATRDSARQHIDAALRTVSDEAKTQAYQAWLGYYNGSTKALGWNQGQLINGANEFARVSLRYEGSGSGAEWKPPGLLAKTVGKMGLKGAPGLNVVREVQGAGGGGGGGGRGQGGGRGGGGGGGGGRGGGGGGRGGGGGGAGRGGGAGGGGGGGRTVPGSGVPGSGPPVGGGGDAPGRGQKRPNSQRGGGAGGQGPAKGGRGRGM